MKLRRNVERKISELKMHGLGRARYWRSRKMEIQAMLTTWAVNIKRMIKLKNGVDVSGLRGLSRHRLRQCLV